MAVVGSKYGVHGLFENATRRLMTAFHEYDENVPMRNAIGGENAPKLDEHIADVVRFVYANTTKSDRVLREAPISFAISERSILKNIKNTKPSISLFESLPDTLRSRCRHVSSNHLDISMSSDRHGLIIDKSRRSEPHTVAIITEPETAELEPNCPIPD